MQNTALLLSMPVFTSTSDIYTGNKSYNIESLCCKRQGDSFFYAFRKLNPVGFYFSLSLFLFHPGSGCSLTPAFKPVIQAYHEHCPLFRAHLTPQPPKGVFGTVVFD